VDREGYDAVKENVFHDPWTTPLSTFSVDVDTASYANVRRLLREGRLPPRGAVRIEEMINYFSYAYPEPEGDVPFSVATEIAECPWRPENRLVRIGLRGRSIPDEAIPPRNLVFLLDVSGSMQPWNKLPLVRKAMKLLVDQLRPEDRVAVVVYAGASGLALEPTSGRDRWRIRSAIERLQASGSTNGAQGIRLAYELAGENFAAGAVNRVILATDGDFNVGVTDRSELLALIEEERERGVFLTVLGVGTGNLQDSQMEMLADRGNGNYAYLDSLEEAEKVLVREAGGTLVTIAKDVKIQVEFNPNRVGAYRLVGYENRKLRDRDFNDDRKDAGEIGAGHTVTALYEITPAGIGPETGVDRLRYQGGRGLEDPAFGGELLTVKLRYKEPDGTTSRLATFPVEDPGNASYGAASEDFRFAAAVAALGIALRNPEGGAGFGPALAAELAATAVGEDPHGYRKEFLRLAERAAELSTVRR
jgi:Ca-activated chloride channel family protein